MLQFLKPGLGAAIFGLRLLVAFAAPPLVFAVFAHEAHPPVQQAATSDESAFLAENDAAMNKMMNAMEAKPTGDVDRDFVAMMAPHHQGAIDMAMRSALRQERTASAYRAGNHRQSAAGNRCDEACDRRSATASFPHQRKPAGARARSPEHVRRDEEIGTTDELFDLEKQPASLSFLIAGTMFACGSFAGQAPGAAASPDIPISHHDRVYAAEQFSNTVSVTDPVDNKLLGVIRLGDPQPGNLSPLYKGQVLVHGMGFSPDHKTLAVVSIGSNSVTFIDTATNAVKHTPMSAVRRMRPFLRPTAMKSG